jgi:uncharacterized protein YndB with AHSA1/START domain
MMLAESQLSIPADIPEMKVTRLIDAPRDLVFDAFSSPAHLAEWWGPKGFTLTTHEMIFAPGGVWRFVMHGPDGRDYNSKIVFREIARPERISYVHPGDDGAEPIKIEATVAFVEEQGKTRLTLRMRFETIAERERAISEYGAAEGGKETLARLDAFVLARSAQAFVISRDFDAPRALLWKALTEPERMAKWWGAEGIPRRRRQHGFPARRRIPLWPKDAGWRRDVGTVRLPGDRGAVAHRSDRFVLR